jgi:hypothetical protein
MEDPEKGCLISPVAEILHHLRIFGWAKFEISP